MSSVTIADGKAYANKFPECEKVCAMANEQKKKETLFRIRMEWKTKNNNHFCEH